MLLSRAARDYLTSNRIPFGTLPDFQVPDDVIEFVTDKICEYDDTLVDEEEMNKLQDFLEDEDKLAEFYREDGNRLESWSEFEGPINIDLYNRHPLLPTLLEEYLPTLGTPRTEEFLRNFYHRERFEDALRQLREEIRTETYNNIRDDLIASFQGEDLEEELAALEETRGDPEMQFAITAGNEDVMTLFANSDEEAVVSFFLTGTRIPYPGFDENPDNPRRTFDPIEVLIFNAGYTFLDSLRDSDFDGDFANNFTRLQESFDIVAELI
jgi:hypothetical protein